MYRGGQLRDILEVSEMGVTTIQQFRHLGPFTHPLSSSPSVDHDLKQPSHAFVATHFGKYSSLSSASQFTNKLRCTPK